MPVAIITGASKGLGRALAAELAARGWDLVLDARSPEPLELVADELRAAGAGRIEAVPGDVTDGWHRGALVAAADGFGGAALLVNNASALGAEPLVPLGELPSEGLRAALETNVVAPHALVRELLPQLRAAGRGGAVLNVSSDAAVEAYETWGGYGAAKAALDHLSAVLAAEEPGLRVWAVDPGDMRTELYAAAVPDDPDFGERLEPAEVAAAIATLVDEDVPSGRYTASALAERGAGSE
ncbi:SDR family NAD(P)-dependent oxidoreductase [Streptomyces sp. A7024]|uniref:SDR family NAD(P)-dependent oxidoreductase n=1 Tax=Streptomyces coryli TaxID=1128680 RepID=A0A6G4U8K5_9ACTN|nr:SDR family NAD(P)-dependent oxidoreductase [Streptomyces coryli]NGN68036.1 SDR family NAD(P)-dependent oxidoreductase [Streptomyces coryli]